MSIWCPNPCHSYMDLERRRTEGREGANVEERQEEFCKLAQSQLSPAPVNAYTVTACSNTKLSSPALCTECRTGASHRKVSYSTDDNFVLLPGVPGQESIRESRSNGSYRNRLTPPASFGSPSSDREFTTKNVSKLTIQLIAIVIEMFDI